MPHRPQKKKKADPKSGDSAKDEKRSVQLAAQRRMEMATRSTLSRFQNRSSERK